MSIWDTLKINLPDYVITTASYKDQKLIASLSNVLQAQDVDELLKWLNHKPFNKKISLQHQKILYVIFDTLSETEVCKLLGISFVKDHNCIHQTILKINNLDTT